MTIICLAYFTAISTYAGHLQWVLNYVRHRVVCVTRRRPALRRSRFRVRRREQRQAIGAAAAELNSLREGWLNPPRVSAAELRKRKLTNLYNQRPTWLDNIHARLDAAVDDAYGWPADLADGEILERLLGAELGARGSINQFRVTVAQSTAVGVRLPSGCGPDHRALPNEGTTHGTNNRRGIHRP